VGSAPGFAFPFFLTSHFGLGRLTDAYFYAFAVSAVLSVLAAVVLETNVLPAATIVAQDGSTRLRAYLVALAFRTSLVAASAYVVVGGIGLVTVQAQSRWTHTQQQLALQLIGIFGLYVVTLAATSTLAGGLYAVGDFLAPTLSQSFRTLVPLGALSFASTGPDGILTCAIALVCGEVARLALLAWLLDRRHDEPSRAEPSALPSIWRSAIPHAISLAVVGINPLIDRLFAARLASGSVTLIDLGEKILAVPVLAVTSSVILVAGARWAKLAPAGDPSLRVDIRRTTHRAFALSSGLAIAILLSVGAASLWLPDFVGGLPISHIGGVVAMFMVGLPAAALVNSGARVLTSLRETRHLPWLAGSALAVNVAGDFIGSAILGVKGIALASSAVRWVNAGLYFVVCRKLLDARQFQGEGCSGTTHE
jgi:peptidoglycan biosynthesis protein MviN/MurJ (putative lipid II flippase)